MNHHQKIWHCALCGALLDADNVYGPEGFDLCRYHHEKFYELVQFLIDHSKPEIPLQPELFGIHPEDYPANVKRKD